MFYNITWKRKNNNNVISGGLTEKQYISLVKEYGSIPAFMNFLEPDNIDVIKEDLPK